MFVRGWGSGSWATIARLVKVGGPITTAATAACSIACASAIWHHLMTDSHVSDQNKVGFCGGSVGLWNRHGHFCCVCCGNALPEWTWPSRSLRTTLPGLGRVVRHKVVCPTGPRLLSWSQWYKIQRQGSRLRTIEYPVVAGSQEALDDGGGSPAQHGACNGICHCWMRVNRRGDCAHWRGLLAFESTVQRVLGDTVVMQ